jgi:hypothetical protein
MDLVWRRQAERDLRHLFDHSIERQARLGSALHAGALARSPNAMFS